MSKETLKQALYLARRMERSYAIAANALDGCPVGGWGETQRARSLISEVLTLEREYTIEEFVDAAYTIDTTDRYRTKAYIKSAWRAQELRDGALSVQPSAEFHPVRVVYADAHKVVCDIGGSRESTPWPVLREAAVQPNESLRQAYSKILEDAEALLSLSTKRTP